MLTLIHKLTGQAVDLFEDAVATFKADIGDAENWLTAEEHAAAALVVEAATDVGLVGNEAITEEVPNASVPADVLVPAPEAVPAAEPVDPVVAETPAGAVQPVMAPAPPVEAPAPASAIPETVVEAATPVAGDTQ